MDYGAIALFGSFILIMNSNLIHEYRILLRNKLFVASCGILLLASLLLSYHMVFTPFRSLDYNAYYFGRSLRSLLVFIIFSGLLSQHSFSQKQIMSTLLIAICIHALIAYLQVIPLEPLRTISRSLNVSVVSMYDHRAAGLAVGYDLAGILVSLGILTSLFLLMFHASERAPKVILSACALFLTGALLFTSRTGIVLTGLFYFGFWYVFQRKTLSLKKVAMQLSILSSGLGFSVFLFFLIAPKLARSMSDVTFESFISFFHGKGFQSQSVTDILDNHYYWSLDRSNILFGNPNSVFKMDAGFIADVGYTQILNGHGLMGLLSLIVLLGGLGLIVFFLHKREKCQIAGFAVLVLLGIAIANLKGPYFFSRQIFDFFLILLSYSVVKHTKVAPIERSIPSNASHGELNMQGWHINDEVV